MSRSGLRRFAAACGVTALVVGGAGLMLTAPVSASGETLTASPSTNLTDGATISVTLNTTAATDANVFVAVTQCGNATSAGTPLSATTANDCVGAAGLGTSLVLINFPGGAVASGSHVLSLVAKKTGIGTNNAQCIPSPPATLPCLITAATATVSGAYTGPGYNFQANTTISYVGATTTTTSPPSTTTTTTPPSTTTTTPPSTTTTTPTTTTTTGPTTTTTAPPSTTTTGPTTTTTAPPSTTTTAPPSTTTTAPPSTTTTKPTTTTTTTAPPTTTTTKPPTTRTFTCTDIPIPASALLVSPNRCLTNGQAVQVSAAAGAIATSGAVSAQASAFVLQCNPDSAIPQDGSGCNLGGLITPPINADGSITPTTFTVKTGQLGANPLSNCPPSQAQADKGAVTCIIAAASGPADPSPLSAGITFAGESVVLPVDSTGNPTTPPPGGTGTGGTTATTNVPAPLAATIAGRTLAFTGPNAPTLWLLLVGAALLDLGYLAISSTWTTKQRRFRRSRS